MKNLMVYILLILLSACCLGLRDGDDDDIDPFDMVNFDPSTKTMKKKDKVQEPQKVTDPAKDIAKDIAGEVQPSSSPPTTTTAMPPVENVKTTEKSMGAVLFKKFVRHFISYFKGKAPETSQEYHVWIKLSKNDYTVLQKFVAGHANIHDAQEIISNMITDVTKSNVGTTAKFSMWFEEKTGASVDAVLKVVAIICLMSVVLYMEISVHISWRKRATQIIMLAFIISIPMTWYEIYQTEQINQQTVTIKEAPKECLKDIEEGNVWSNLAGAFSHLFTFEKDKCRQYYEHLLIDPLLKVTPTKAIAVTFVRFFLSPLKDVGTAFSEFMRALLIDLPLTLYPIAIVTISIFFFLLLFMWFGYSIRLPFFLSIEPSPMVAVGSSVDNTQAIEDVKKQLEAIQNTIQQSETNMADKMKQLAATQMQSIEYTAAAMQSNTKIPSPTLQSAITVSSSDHRVETCSDDHVKSPIPCSDDSFSGVEDFVVTEDSTSVIVQETMPIDNIGPSS